MIFVLRGFGRRVAFALLRAHVHEKRPIVRVADIFEHGQQLIEIVTIDNADVVESELFEQRPARNEAARQFFGEVRLLLEEFRQVIGDLFADVAQRHVRRARQQTREIVRHGADGRRDRHLIVVQDHDKTPVHCAGIVHGLVGHAGRYCAIADHADDIVLLTGKVASDRHAQSSRDRR